LDRGEDVVSGLGKRMTSRDLVKIMKDAGWKPADFRTSASYAFTMPSANVTLTTRFK
jgi:hypothetical protein